MAEKPYSLKALFYLSKVLLTKICNKLHFLKKAKNFHSCQSQNHKHPFLVDGQDSLSDKTLMFHVEGALLKSSSVFPYFMLVAFEAGGPLRALILLLLYPFVWLVGQELGLKIMTFVCFVGIKEESFRIGRTVLPKFFLEDVGNEGFDMVMRCGRKVGVSDLPKVMVEGFLRGYLGVEAVVARELKVVCGYFVGLMEENKAGIGVLNEIFGEEKLGSHVVGIFCFNNCLDHHLYSHCQVVHLVSEAEKRNWKFLPRKKYPRPLIFHDGRLAFKPTPLATLVMFIWLPLGLLLFSIRLTVVLLLPYQLSLPMLCFIGMGGTLSRPNSFANQANTEEKSKGIFYVCNHRTLIDPIYLAIALMKPLTAVTYSLSQVSEMLSPIKTVRLTRNREKDSETIERMLSQGDLVICPEGTTCREPYLLRFSPLFAEISDDIVPIAIDFHVGMFYGTTASGFKCLDPVFILMNPTATCSIKILEKLPKSFTCRGGGKSKFEVANYVQAQIAKALKFEGTCLTRKDKYVILAGNEGII